MATNLKILRFLGEDLMAEVVTETTESITIRNPVRIVVVPSKTDPSNPSVGFAPYCEWTDEKEFVLSKTLLLFVAEPLTVFTNQYNQQFGGIIVPDTKIIM